MKISGPEVDKPLRDIAYHEAGHYVASVLFRLAPVWGISIKPGNDDLGRVATRANEWPLIKRIYRDYPKAHGELRTIVEMEVFRLLAGQAAEAKLFRATKEKAAKLLYFCIIKGSKDEDGPRAFEMLKLFEPDREERLRWLASIYSFTLKTIGQRRWWALVQHVAEIVLERETLWVEGLQYRDHRKPAKWVYENLDGTSGNTKLLEGTGKHGPARLLARKLRKQARIDELKDAEEDERNILTRLATLRNKPKGKEA